MKIRHILSMTVLTLLAGFAYAGLVAPAPVVIDLDNRFAQGDQFTARKAMNDHEFIGCGSRTLDDGVIPLFRFGFCQAVNSEGDEIVCFTERASLLDEIRATSAYAFITFSWDENDECTRVGFSTQSFYLPKK